MKHARAFVPVCVLGILLLALLWERGEPESLGGAETRDAAASATDSATLENRVRGEGPPVRESDPEEAAVEALPPLDPDRSRVFLEVVWAETGEPARELAFHHGPGDAIHLAHTDVDGLCVLDGIGPGAWVFARGGEKEVWLQAGQEQRIRWELPPAPAGITGIVLDAEGRPVPEAELTLTQFHTYIEPFGEPRHGTSDAEGRFSFAGPLAGAALIEARRSPLQGRRFVGPIGPGVRPQVQVLVLSDPLAKWDPAAEARWVTVRGTVRDEEGVPLAGIRVRSELLNRDYRAMHFVDSTTSSASGAFTLRAAVGNEVCADAAEYGNARWVVPRDTVDTELRWDPVLRCERMIRGRLVDAFDAPLAGWQVHGVGWGRETARTDRDGRFRMGVFTGRGEVRLHAYAGSTNEAPGATYVGNPEPDEEVLLRALTPEQRGAVRGRLIDPSGEAFPGAQLFLSSRSLQLSTSKSVGPDGLFEFVGLPPGTYRLHSYPVQSELRRVDIVAGETLDLGALEAPSTAKVLVQAEGLAAKDELRIQYVTEGGVWQECWPDVGGYYELGERRRDRLSRVVPTTARALLVGSDRTAYVRVPVSLRPGDYRLVTVNLGPGIEQKLRLPLGWTGTYRVLDLGGLVVLPPQRFRSNQPGQSWTLRMSRGSYRVEVQPEGGELVQSEAFAVPGPPVTVSR